jgi:ABC-type phosphate transport system permease subunit
MISKIFDWLQSPMESEASISEWAAGLVLILIVSFLWSTVVRQTID